MEKRAAIILAAGISSRMNTKLPKVLHEVCGRPMLAYVLDACRQVGIDKILVVVGYESEQVKKRFADQNDITWITQQEQKGTAHAALCCREQLADFDGQTFVLCGDGPLIRSETLEAIIQEHQSGNPAATLATATLEDPAGYGRIVRDKYGNIQGIIEDSDCSPEEKNIKEINPSYYLFNNQLLLQAAEQVQPHNVKKEYYLTDALSIIISQGKKVLAVTAVKPEEAKSINSREQLSDVTSIMQQRIQKKLMENGVTIVDPQTSWIDARAKIDQDTVIEPFTYIQGEVRVHQNSRIGPFAYIKGNVVLQKNSSIKPGSIVTEQNTDKFAWKE